MAGASRDKYVGDLYNNAAAIDEISRCLDPQFKNIKNWEHFAFALGVPPDTIRTCKLYSEYSPTIRVFKYLEVIKPDMTVGDLRAALTRNPERARNDLDRMLEDKLANDCKVSEAITNSTSEILDKMALKLDSASAPTCTWIDFGLELGITRDKLKEFEMYTNYNPTEALFRYLYTASAKPLKASLIVGYFEKMDRQDILEVIKQTILSSDIDSKDAKDIFKHGSKLLETTARKLNEDSPGVGGWKGLASHLIADQYIDDPDIISKLEPPQRHEIHSPTKKIIEWLSANKLDVSIGELIAKCEEVGRNDAVKILIGHYSRAVEVFDDVPTSPPYSVQETTKAAEHILKDHLRNFGLPKRITGIIGREENKAELLEQILHPENHLIVLHAATGYGKETLAVATAYELIDKHDFTCIYVDSDGILSVEDLAIKILTTCGIPAPSVGEKEKLQELLKIVTRKCLLILDNLDHAFHADDKRRDSMDKSIRTTYKPSFSGNSTASSNISESSAAAFASSSANLPGIPTSISFAPYRSGIVHSISHDSFTANTSHCTSSNSKQFQDFQQMDRKEEYQKFIEDLLKYSTSWTILATTWESFSTAVNTQEFELPPLTRSHSEELFLSRCELAHRIDRSNIPRDLLTNVLKCCSGIPQLLRNAAAVFVKVGFEAGANRIASSPLERQLELLNTNKMSQKERFNYCLGICFDRLTKTSQDALMMISVFPGFFSLEVAATVFKAIISNKTELEDALTELMDFSFLCFDQDQNAYYLSPAMRSFAIYKATHEPPTLTSSESDDCFGTELSHTYKSAISRFVYYTFAITLNIENDFFSKHSADAIQKYREQEPNLREIANWFISDRLSNDPDMKRLRYYIIESFIACYLVNIKVMSGNLLKTILRWFLRFCREEEGMNSTHESKNEGSKDCAKKQYVECLTYGGVTCILGCLCVPQLCPIALDQALWCFNEVLEVLCTQAKATLKMHFEILSTCESMSKGAQTQFLLKYGKCLVRQGRKAEGLKFVERGIEIREEVFEKSKSTKDCVMVAVGYNDLASAHSYNNDANGTAIQIRQSKVLPVYEEHLGRHPFTASALSHLAHDFLALDFYEEALKACQRALSYRKRLFGEHSETARSLFDKGHILRKQAGQFKDHGDKQSSKLKDALFYLKEALEMRQHLAFTSKETAENHVEIVRVLKSLGREEEAKEHEEKAGICMKQVDYSHMGECMD